MKMSDVFNLPLRVHAGSVMCEGVTCFNKPHPELHMRGINYTGDEVKLAQYTAFAINNHDQMTSKIISMQDEIAELRGLLQQSREKIVELYSIGSFKVRVDVSDVLGKSERLLDK